MTHRNGSRLGSDRIGTRIYRMAMRLLPTDFRDEFGEDMVNLLDQRIRDVGVDPWERLWIWLLSLLDLACQTVTLRFGPQVPSRPPENRWGKGQWLESVRQDLGFGIRTLKRSPGFLLVAGVTLAVGMGANTVMFSLVNGVLLNPLDFEEPGRLVWVQEQAENGGELTVSYPNYRDWRDQAGSIQALAAGSRPSSQTLRGMGEAFSGHTMGVSEDFFDTFRVRPIVGRALLPEEHIPGAAFRAMVSEAFWRDHLGSPISLEG